MSEPVYVRAAETTDEHFIVASNCRLAWETEHKQLDRPTVTLGVRTALADPSKARYFIACAGEQPVGQIMHTWEWSDWRNGDLWWLQSVYVVPEYRGRGVFRLLFEHVRDLARANPGVVGIRLYVEHHNTAAQAVYRKLGMVEAGYEVLEMPLTR
jgi:ribosomal protein S18 acetylase RimI-like enzyme